MYLLKNLNVYSPKFIGENDVFIVNEKINFIEKNITLPKSNFPLHEDIDCTGLIAIPGLIDLHVHIAGAGGEGGFSSRTPEMHVNDFFKNGVTTCVGLLGTDGTTRNIENLYAKSKSLEEQGLSTYLWTGSYEVPTPTLTGSIRRDVVFIDKVIGVGEVAISDHRGSYASFNELTKMVAESRVAGLISGKCGITHFHLGDGKSMLDPIEEIIERSDIPYENILPTHINRNTPLFNECVKYCKSGGYVDITTGIKPNNDDVVDPSIAFKTLLENGCSLKNITMSSDAGGSMPIFDSNGHLIEISISSPSTNMEVVLDLIKSNVDIETAISPLTINPASLLKLHNKGQIKEGFSADILLLDKDFNIHSVISKGKFIIKNYKII